MLIITGLGRSGTSCLAGFCERLGLMSDNKWFDSIHAGGENEEVTRINHAIRDAYRKRRFSAEDFRERIQAISEPVVKDPRFTWTCPVLLPAWLEARDDLRFLISHRDFKSVVASKTATRSSSLRWTLECKWVFAKFLLRLSDLNVPFYVIKFPDYLDDYERVYGALSTFGRLDIDYSEGEKQWNEWIDRSKIGY